MKTVYVALSFTGTSVSRLIKYYTKEPYSHVSISLDENLDKLYSFARKRPYNPFAAGFIEENFHTGTFKRFSDSVGAVYSLKVTEEQYEVIKSIIGIFENNKDMYSYNLIGVLLIAFGKGYKNKNKYFCSQFVAFVLKEAGINLFNKDPELVKPYDFRNCEKLTLIYDGVLKRYNQYNYVTQPV